MNRLSLRLIHKECVEKLSNKSRYAPIGDTNESENGLKNLYLAALSYQRCTIKSPLTIYWTVSGIGILGSSHTGFIANSSSVASIGGG
jgi:hypothetical protein